MVDDFIAFDDAVKAACDFAEKEGQALVPAGLHCYRYPHMTSNGPAMVC
jgi:hypothetical protein